MVTRASDSCFTVWDRTRPNARGVIPTHTADSKAASRHAVPEADSQFTVYIAAYPEGLATAGGMRSMVLCRPGHGKAAVTPFSRVCMGLYPHSSTNTTSSTYGPQARASSPADCR